MPDRARPRVVIFLRSTSFLFAYGTLQRGKAPPEIREALTSVHPVGKASVSGRIYDLGEYPAAVFQDGFNGAVWGTVLRLPRDPIKRNKLLLKLDQYEGVNPDEPARSLFVRRQLCVNLRSGRKLKCWAYEYNGKAQLSTAIFDGYYIGPRKHRRMSAKRRGANMRGNK
jgi:gamma-glutamylcyclotransferase (GGCT)/AIG2-like uncharacterized protein YtfP